MSPNDTRVAGRVNYSPGNGDEQAERRRCIAPFLIDRAPDTMWTSSWRRDVQCESTRTCPQRCRARFALVDRRADRAV